MSVYWITSIQAGRGGAVAEQRHPALNFGIGYIFRVCMGQGAGKIFCFGNGEIDALVYA